MYLSLTYHQADPIPQPGGGDVNPVDVMDGSSEFLNAPISMENGIKKRATVWASTIIQDFSWVTNKKIRLPKSNASTGHMEVIVLYTKAYGVSNINALILCHIFLRPLTFLKTWKEMGAHVTRRGQATEPMVADASLALTWQPFGSATPETMIYTCLAARSPMLSSRLSNNARCSGWLG